MLHRFARLAAVALFVAGCQGPAREPACTQRWCDEGLTVTFGDTPWPAGSYAFVVVADGVRTRCRAMLPFEGCAAPAAACEHPDVTLATSGCALAPERHGIRALRLRQIPSSLDVTVYGPGGRAHLRQTIRPVCAHPNGPQCDARPCCSSEVAAPNLAPQADAREMN